MSSKDWVNSQQFLSTWKDSFCDTKKYFLKFSKTVSVRRYKAKKTGRLWTEVRLPYPGIHLLAVCMQPDDILHTLWLTVWVDQRSQFLYDQLLSQGPPEILGKDTVGSANHKPPSSWQSQLQKKGISLLGLEYSFSDPTFLRDPSVAGAQLRRVGDEFFNWLIANLRVRQLPDD